MFLKLIILVSCATLSFGKQLPPDVTQCHAGDTECIAKNANYLIRNNGKGRPDLGVIPYDPFILRNFSVNEHSQRPISLNLFIREAKVLGMSQIKVQKAVGFKKNPRQSKFEWYGTLPKLQIVGKYKVDGRILLLPIQGEGDFDMTITDVDFQLKIKPKFIEQSGYTYVGVEKTKLHVEPKGFKISLTNLFNGNKQLTKSMVEILNDNWKDAWEELRPAFLEVTNGLNTELFNGFFTKYEYEDLFLPDNE